MTPRPILAKSPGRAALLLAASLAAPAAAWAARPVPVFQVPLAGQSVPDLQQALRDALVRATGRRESASDPVFGPLIAAAPHYVQGYEHGQQGEPTVIFNAAALDKAIAGLDRAVWDPSRPFTLVVLSPPPDQTDQATDQAGLEQAAEQRGLPISIVPLPVTDGSGNLLPRAALLQMAHRYGAEQLLLGRPPAEATASATPAAAANPIAPAQAGTSATPGAVPAPAATGAPGAASPAPAQRAWQWTLYTDFTSKTWNGALTAGIEDTVDLLAPPAGPVSANAPVPTRIAIEGVSSLADYANIEQMLGAVPGVSSATVEQVSGDSVVFDLTVRGGATALGGELAGSPSFTRVQSAATADGAELVLRYRPG
jgi:hypothetical protein